MWNWHKSLRAALDIGLKPDEWRKMTPAELAMMQRAELRRREREQEERNAQAYILAGLVRRFTWDKVPPTYNEIFHPEKERLDGEMTDEELFEQVRALNAMLGGREVGFDRPEGG